MARRKPTKQELRFKAAVLKRLGRQIRQLRLERGLTQDEVAGEAKISYKHLGRIELSKAEPGAVALVQRARAFKVSVGELFETLTPTNATGFRVSPVELDRFSDGLAALNALVTRVRAGQSAPLPLRAPRKPRK